MRAWATFAIAAIATSVFFIDFCAWFYGCGCQSLWAGAAEHCNIHTPGVKHCPWCSIGTSGAVLVYGAMLASQGAVSYKMRRTGWWPRLFLSLGLFPISGVLLGFVVGWLTQYYN